MKQEKCQVMCCCQLSGLLSSGRRYRYQLIDNSDTGAVFIGIDILIVYRGIAIRYHTSRAMNIAHHMQLLAAWTSQSRQSTV